MDVAGKILMPAERLNNIVTLLYRGRGMMRPGGFNGPMNGGGKRRKLSLDAGLQRCTLFQV